MQTQSQSNSFLTFFAIMAAGLLMSAGLDNHAAADAGTRVEKMTYSQLNRLITEGDCNCVMVFMASWCAPCREELPEIDRLYRRYGDRGIRFIGVSVDSGGPAAIESVIREKKVTFPVYWVGEVAIDELNIFGIPMIFFVKNGRIVEKIPGKRSYEFFEGKIETFLKP